MLPVLRSSMPAEFGTYHEPFLGGGALLFHILAGSPGQKCRVSDLNPDLILAYTTIRDRVGDLVSSLKDRARKYARDPSAYYYHVRGSSPRSRVEKVSRLIFLNRTCFNGLYRVNSKGGFNVPWGRYAKPNIVGDENLRSISSILRAGRVEISRCDFLSVADHVSKGDFVYFDPPYVPVSSTASFTQYTRSGFGPEDLRRLARLCADLDERGAYVMLSNSHLDEVSRLFTKGWRKQKIPAARCINSDSTKRSGHYELLVTNYLPGAGAGGPGRGR